MVNKSKKLVSGRGVHISEEVFQMQGIQISHPLSLNRQTERQMDRQTEGQDHLLSQADALTKNYQGEA